MGFNADEEKIEDLVQSGVIDPTEVVRVAIQNASSIAGLLLHHRSVDLRTAGETEGWRPRRSWSRGWISGFRLGVAIEGGG